jgi:hypothetical protein
MRMSSALLYLLPAIMALASAIELAELLGAHLKIVTVVEALPSFYNIAAIVSPSVVDESLEGKRSRLRTLQQSAIKRATAAGVIADAILVDGGEVSGIFRAAQASMQISWSSACQNITGSEHSIPPRTTRRTIPLALCSRSARTLPYSWGRSEQIRQVIAGGLR